MGTFLSLYCKTDIRSVLLGREEAGQTHGQEAAAWRLPLTPAPMRPPQQCTRAAAMLVLVVDKIYRAQVSEALTGVTVVTFSVDDLSEIQRKVSRWADSTC